MDTGKGTFEQVEVDPADQGKLKGLMAMLEEKHPEHGGWFHVGEIIVIRGSSFRIKAVKPTELRLKLLPRVK